MDFLKIKFIKDGLSLLKINKPTSIQQKTWDAYNQSDSNLIISSNTGTGKTLAFLVPVLNQINFELNKLQAIILVPTRELARQINTVLSYFKKVNSKIKSVLLIGGNDYNKQVNNVLKIPHIIVSTPDRLIKVINETNIDLSDVKNLVLDETDMLIDLGFFNSIETIINQYISSDTRKIATSATLHELLSFQLAKFFKNAKIIDNNQNLDQMKIKHICVYNHDKFHSLSTIISQIKPFLCIIFTNTKDQALSLYKKLYAMGLNVTQLHGGLSERARKNNYKNIKSLKYQYVVATDLVSRGIDIDGASHIIHYDLPEDYEWYIHRSGRCGRNKYSGEVYLLIDKDYDDFLNKLIKKNIVFAHAKIKNNQLVETNKVIKKTKKIINIDQENEIKKLILSARKNVKPNYKSKLKKSILKIKNKYKRQAIDNKIKQNLIKGYKQKNSKKPNF